MLFAYNTFEWMFELTQPDAGKRAGSDKENGTSKNEDVNSCNAKKWELCSQCTRGNE